MFVFPIHLNLFEHVEVRLEAFPWTNVLDAIYQLLAVTRRLLQTKLVAWEGQNLKVIEGLL